MKILMAMNVPYTRWHGGANRSNRALLEGLAARGHTVAVVTPQLARGKVNVVDVLRPIRVTVSMGIGKQEHAMDLLDAAATGAERMPLAESVEPGTVIYAELRHDRTGRQRDGHQERAKSCLSGVPVGRSVALG